MKLEALQLQMLINNTKRILFLFAVLLFSILKSNTTLGLADSTKSKVVLTYDTSTITVRQPNTVAQEELLENSDYKYDRVGPAPKTWWDRFKEWFWRTIEKIFTTEGGKVGLTIFQYVLIAAVIVIIVFLILKNDIRAVFYGKSASVVIDFKEFEEDIHKINFDQMIAEAMSRNDYRKAVRLHFLKLLKELTDNNLITWQIDKTNNDYLMELSNSKFSKQFQELALMYEYIWYGDFQLDETNFKNTISKFKDFKVKA